VVDYEVLTNSRFYLEIKLEGSDEKIDAYFMECRGFKRTQEIIEIAEVTDQRWAEKGQSQQKGKVGRVVRTKIPGNPKSDNITLKLGMTVSDTMWRWFQAVEQGDWANQFRTGDITLYAQGGNPQARFRFLGAWPVSYKIGDLNAGGSDFQIEELELSVDEFLRVQTDGGDTA
jgi:phage tail-like protein